MKSPSPHSFRAMQLKNKITDTSLFAELVKHRHKHETEIKTLEHLLEKNSDPKVTAKETIKETVKANIDQIDGSRLEDIHNNVPMDIDDIPIPEEIKTEVQDIALPNHVAEKPNNVHAAPAPPPLPPQIPPFPSESTENGGKVGQENKVKKVTKLPMPPGINQTDLEAIESPPSRSPTPPPAIKARTPPRKGIMNLPMPPGKKLVTIFFLIILI